MNELTLVRFIDAMQRNENDTHNKLYIDLMVEEVEGFLEYPRLVAYFEKFTPTAYKRLRDALDNQKDLTRNNTPFRALVATDPTGTVSIPQKVLFFYVKDERMALDVVDWINLQPLVTTYDVGAVADAWEMGNHLSYPYEEIKSPYLYPVYLDKVVPGKTCELTVLLMALSAEVLKSEAGKTWTSQTKLESHWEQMGYKKYKPE